MKKLKIKSIFLVLFILSGVAFAEEPVEVTEPKAESELSDKREDSLKARRKFNRLKRSTQNIYELTMRPKVAYKLQTALDYISVIDLAEEVETAEVFAGSQELFKIEVYGNHITIKPITDEVDARTNLVLFTKSGERLAFDVTVGPPDTADFVLDFHLPQEDETLVRNAFKQKVEEKVQEFEKTYQEKEEKLEEKAEKLSEKKIKEKVASGVQNIKLKKAGSAEEVQVNLLSLSQVADKAYLRFSILNYSRTPYTALKVMVGVQSYERKFLKNRESGFIEIPAELTLPTVIYPDKYEYGVITFDFRTLGKKEKPVFRILEDSSQARNVEVKGFKWFE